MKKVLLTLLCAIVCSTFAFAQKGTSAVGINLGYGITFGDAYKDYPNVPIGIKYQYSVSDALRIEAAFNYGIGIKKDFYGAKCSMDAITYGINAHYIVNPESSLKFYPIVGIGAGTLTSRVSEDGDSDSASKSGFMYNIGAGAEYSLNEKMALGLEIKFQSVMVKDWDNFNQLPILLGFTYKF